MSVTITYFVHGTTTDNESGISSGWYDVELSRLGVEQSLKLKELIKDQKFDVVFCSDLQRARASAELTFSGACPIIPDKRFRECNYGKLNAHPSSIVEPMQEAECIENRFPEGESYEDVKARVAKFLEFLKKDYEGKSVAIVAHKAPQLALDVLIKGKLGKKLSQKIGEKLSLGNLDGDMYFRDKPFYLMLQSDYVSSKMAVTIYKRCVAE